MLSLSPTKLMFSGAQVTNKQTDIHFPKTFKIGSAVAAGRSSERTNIHIYVQTFAFITVFKSLLYIIAVFEAI